MEMPPVAAATALAAAAAQEREAAADEGGVVTEGQEERGELVFELVKPLAVETGIIAALWSHGV